MRVVRSIIFMLEQYLKIDELTLIYYLFGFSRVISDGPNVVNSIPDPSLKRLWDTSLVEVSVLATFLLITPFFEAVFLPRGNFTIVLFFAC